MNNWYYFYDSRGIDKSDFKWLSSKFEILGYEYHEPTGLGAGSDLEQVILCIHNNQLLSGVSLGVFSNLIYDLLKNIFFWSKTHRFKNKAVPILEVFLHFKDIDNERTRAVLRFRMDCELNEDQLKKSVSRQIEFLHSSSDEEVSCYHCKETIPSHCVFYLKRNEINKPICQRCYESQHVR